MAKNETNSIFINDVEYDVESLTDEQRILVNHIADLDRKLGSAKFNIDQLTVGREAFFNMLTQSLQSSEETE
jgi:hypothetical protein